ncbi:hypothetical protein [Clostridium sp.]|uniref:hypothetical protein n=1 Tax=Clostridium sp. TaxID=1506 RepID=UPI003F3D5C2E
MEELTICDICKKEMEDGYSINDGDEYFCSLKCLNEKYSDVTYKELYEEGIAHWTTF